MANKKTLKQKIARWLVGLAKLDEEYPNHAAKKFGDMKGVTFEMDGLVKTYCSVVGWATGEGFDISWETEENRRIKLWESKSISLHSVELDCMLKGLEYMKYFEHDSNE